MKFESIMVCSVSADDTDGLIRRGRLNDYQILHMVEYSSNWYMGRTVMVMEYMKTVRNTYARAVKPWK